MDSELLFSLIVSSVLLIMICLFVITLTSIYLKKKRQHLIEKKELQQAYEQTLLQSQLEIQEQTLQNISHELHDNLGQIASLIKINLNTLDKSSNSYSEKVEDTKDLIRQLILDLKLLSRNLNSNSITQIGLIESIKKEVDRLQKLALFQIHFDYPNSSPELTDEKTIIIFRIIQELLNNIIQHSQATIVAISIRVTRDLFILVVRDNGIGFDLNTASDKGSSGLYNLKNRVKMLDANLSIESAPATGTTITIEMPL